MGQPEEKEVLRIQRAGEWWERTVEGKSEHLRRREEPFWRGGRK